MLKFCIIIEFGVVRLITRRNNSNNGDGDTNCSLYTWNGPQGFGKETGGIGDYGKNWDHPDHSIKIG